MPNPSAIFYGSAYEHGDVSADVELAYGWARVRVCTPTTSGLAYVLPDAQTCPVGHDIFFLVSEAVDPSGEDIAVEDNTNSNLATITPQTVARCHLRDNSTQAGDWVVQVVAYGDIPSVPDPNRAYFFGGLSSTQLVTEFDPDGGSWATKTNNPGGHNNYSCGFGLNDRCYTCKGGLAQDFYEYDPDTWTAKTSSGDNYGTSSGDANNGSGRDNGSGVLDGFMLSSASDSDGTEGYDQTGDSWAYFADNIELQRAPVHAQGNDGTIFNFGGQTTGTTPRANVNAYDISGDSWSASVDLPTALTSGCSAQIAPDAHILGGRIGAGTGRTDAHLVFDMVAESYSVDVDLPDPQARGGAVDFGESFVMGDGETDTDTNGGDNTYIFDGAGFIVVDDQPGTSTFHRNYQHATMKAPA